MAEPKGKLVTPVAFDGDGNPVALEVDADGNLKVTGGDGVSTFVALTDTPANYTGVANKRLAVNAGEDAVEFVDSLAITTAKARVYLQGDQENIPNSTETKLLLTNATFDPSSLFANSKLTIKVAGTYLICGSVGYGKIGLVANKNYYARIWLNGGPIITQLLQTAFADVVIPMAVDLYDLAVDDELELYCFHQAGVDTVDIIGTSSYTFLSIHILSAT